MNHIANGQIELGGKSEEMLVIKTIVNRKSIVEIIEFKWNSNRIEKCRDAWAQQWISLLAAANSLNNVTNYNNSYRRLFWCSMHSVDDIFYTLGSPCRIARRL